jgi:WD40 repeat protein/energy-coupling factor transporter ATP-binding protein EcfA2
MEPSLQFFSEEPLSNPFPGLRPFEVWENYLFFGRDRQVDGLLKKLSQQRFVAVVGTSGSGKSSLVRAGLLPALFGGFMVSAGSTWRIAVMRPGSSPIRNLAEALSSPDVFGSRDDAAREAQVAEQASVLDTSSLGLVQVVRQAQLPSDENLLLVVDQFEELFRFKENTTIADAANEASAFVKLLLEAVHQRELSIYVLLTLRSDFLGDCAQFRDLPETINEGHYLIPRLRREQQREAILGPVAVGGGKISPRLVQQLLNDLGDNPDQLPILQHSLMQTWDQWQRDHEGGEPIDLRHYDAIGKMGHALSQHADEAYNELPDDRSRKICESLFKCLTMRGPDNRGIRRPTKIRDICAIAEATPEEVIAVVEYFRKPGRSFIMPPHNVPLTPDTVLDISHESLMRVWDRLVKWVDDDADSAAMYMRLVESYGLHEKGQAGLWRDPELQEALNWREANEPNASWAKRFSPLFTGTMGFLEDSQKLRDRERQEARRRKRIVNAIVIAFLGFAGLLTVWALTERSSATKSARAAVEQEKIALEQKSIAQKQREQAEQSALIAQAETKKADSAKTEAEKQRKIAELRGAEALSQKQQAEKARLEAEHSSAIANEERSAAERQSHIADSLKNVAENSAHTVSRLRLLSIAKALAVKSSHLQSDDDNLIGLLALQSYEFNTLNNGAVDDPDIFNALRTANNRLNGTKLELAGAHGSSIRKAIYTKQGDIISVSTDGKIVRWFKDGSHRLLGALGSGVRNIALSPDESTLCVAGSDRQLRILSVTNPGNAALAPTAKIPIKHVIDEAFLPSQRIALLANDGKISIWNITESTLTDTLVATSGIHCLQVNAQGTVLAAGCGNGTVLLWNTETLGTSPTRLESAGPKVTSLAFSDNANLLAAGTERGYVAEWDLRNSKQKPTVEITNGYPIHAIAFNASTTMLAAGSSDGKIRFWNPERLTDLPIAITDNTSFIWSLAFSPDGKTLAAACSDHSVHLVPTSAPVLADEVQPEMKRNLTKKEWDEYVGKDIPYMKTVANLAVGE